MPAPVTTDSVWREVQKRLFAVLAMVNDRGEARSAGIVYVVRDRRIYIATGEDTFKARWVRSNPAVSMTVTIPKRVPFLPFLPIPQATITFQGYAEVRGLDQVPEGVVKELLRGLEASVEEEPFSIIEVRPLGRFLTYGIGVPLLTMRKPEESRGTAPVSPQA